MNYKIVILIINIAIALAMVFVAYRRSKVSGAISLTTLSLALVVWSVSYLLYEFRPDPGLDRFLIALVFLSMMAAASAQLTFTLLYTNHSNLLTRSVIILLAVMPVVTQVLFWTFPWSAILFQNQSSWGSLEFFGSAWGRITTFYVFNLSGASTLLLIDAYIRKPRSLFFRSWMILAGAMAPMLDQMLNIVGLTRLPQNATPLLAFTLTGLGFSYALFSRNLIELTLVSRDAVVEGMDDGWIVLNAQNIVVDINPAAENIVGLSRDKVYGHLITSILGDLPSLGQTFSGDQELEMKRSLKSQDGWRYLDIRVSPIKGRNGQNSGHLIVWRDITERRLTEDARQRARDEMFVLLNAISSAASNAINLDDFLSESIYQIIYPFRSQIVAVFLTDDGNNGTSDPSLFLASHFGLSAEVVDNMTCLSNSNPLVEWIFTNRQTLLIEDTRNDPRIPSAMQGMALSCALVVPLVTQAGEDSKFLGFMCLARKEGLVFSPNETIRLAMISDHIATLIDSDRRRKLAIALSERQRLLRDLHDSVSQKLYGVVTLTEAAQAALEAGATVNSSQVLAKIGENARQAVREMRLFLYQMQPVEIEKEGFISALHHRLAAVEGRADIKARLLTHENILLSKEKEVALYFIAQEALNNVLRHAHAKSITVTLKKRRRNVILEISDDGRGFDPQLVDRGGLGLMNMKERVLQIGGELKVKSKPGEGTRILVSIRSDESEK